MAFMEKKLQIPARVETARPSMKKPMKAALEVRLLSGGSPQVPSLSRNQFPGRGSGAASALDISTWTVDCLAKDGLAGLTCSGKETEES